MKIIDFTLDNVTPEKLRQLARMVLENQARLAMRQMARYGADANVIVASGAHALKKHLPAAPAMELAEHLWHEFKIDARETKYTNRNHINDVSEFIAMADELKATEDAWRDKGQTKKRFA